MHEHPPTLDVMSSGFWLATSRQLSLADAVRGITVFMPWPVMCDV
jgi:hypothetical protein